MLMDMPAMRAKRRALQNIRIPNRGISWPAAGTLGGSIGKPWAYLMNRGRWVLAWLYVVAFCLARITLVKSSSFQGASFEINGTRTSGSTANDSTAHYDCTKAGPCLPCTLEETEEYCRDTGYREEVKCRPVAKMDDVERDAGGSGNKVQGMTEDSDSASESYATSNERLDSSPASEGNMTEERADGFQKDSSNGDERRQKTKLGHRQRSTTFRSCLPLQVEEDEKLTVWAFEGIMLATFAVAAPVVHYRRPRNSIPSGMSRIPGSAWFGL